jgi:hypothetical protein
MEGSKPRTGARAEAERAARHGREAAALRENLRRRKEQQRAREAAAVAAATETPGTEDEVPCP